MAVRKEDLEERSNIQQSRKNQELLADLESCIDVRLRKTWKPGGETCVQIPKHPPEILDELARRYREAGYEVSFDEPQSTRGGIMTVIRLR